MKTRNQHSLFHIWYTRKTPQKDFNITTSHRNYIDLIVIFIRFITKNSDLRSIKNQPQLFKITTFYNVILLQQQTTAKVM